jgi:hypothetical protein
MCPAMLESEYEITRELYPDRTREWEKILAKYAQKEHISDEAMKCGWWRWKSAPPKMVELMNESGIQINSQRSIKPKNKR